MSSSTSSSDRYRRFTLGVLLLAFVPAAAFFAVGIWLQPLDGDLTRAGSFSQRHYGWNSAQLVHRQVRYAGGTYDRPYDIVVIGDSFATAMPSHQWQNRVVEATGMSLLTLSSYTDRLDALFDNATYAATPPRYLILTLVERHFPEQLARLAACDPAVAAELAARPATAAREELAPEPLRTLPPIGDPVESRRATHWHDLREVKIGYAAKTLFYGLLRQLSDRQRTKVLRLELARNDLFSSLDREATLFFKGDLDRRAQWEADGLDGLACRIETLRRRVEADGRTGFVMMLPPDKLTAYAPYLKDPAAAGQSRLAELARRLPDTMPRIDRAIAAAIAGGHVDVYLPNNTHWGYAGHLAAGEAVAAFLARGETGRLRHPHTAGTTHGP